MINAINVVAALIKKDDKYFIAQRAESKDAMAGKWEFPGGKVENGETNEQAIEREMVEEFSIVVKAKKHLIDSLYDYPTRTINLQLYECEYVSGDFTLHSDHLDYRWVTKEEMSNYEFCSSDELFVKYIKDNMN